MIIQKIPTDQINPAAYNPLSGTSAPGKIGRLKTNLNRCEKSSESEKNEGKPCKYSQTVI